MCMWRVMITVHTVMLVAFKLSFKRRHAICTIKFAARKRVPLLDTAAVHVAGVCRDLLNHDDSPVSILGVNIYSLLSHPSPTRADSRLT